MKNITCIKCKQIVDKTATNQKYCVSCQLLFKTCPDCGRISPHRNKKKQSCWKCHIKLHHSGSQHPNWKGGRVISKGYVLIYCPNHPRKESDCYVREHILVWEKFNNTFLPKNWIIHHLNGIKDDNRIENLVALSTLSHAKVLSEKAKRIRELEYKLSLLS